MPIKREPEAKNALVSEETEAQRKPVLPPEARRALAEAEERRRQAAEVAKAQGQKAIERNGPKGPEPTRYGDWERKGIVSDF